MIHGGENRGKWKESWRENEKEERGEETAGGVERGDLEM